MYDRRPVTLSRPGSGDALRGSWWVSVVLCSLATVLPFLAVGTPPITDLPQQVAQMRLAGEALANPGSPYEIQWLFPNTLGAVPLALGWWLASPLGAGALALALIGISWVAAIHGAARAANRSSSAAALACLFFWNHITYWGFVPFLVGLPVFLLWLTLLRRDDQRRHHLVLVSVAFALYLAHVLWLVAGAAWLLAEALWARRGWRATATRGATLVPALAAVAWWYPRFAATGFESETVWGRNPLERLDPSWWAPSALGGLHGPTTGLMLGLVGAWLVVGVWTARHDLRAAVDTHLLAAAGLFVLAALTLPGVHRHTIFFASRWVPVAAVLVVLALPAPRVRPALRDLLAWSAIWALAAATTDTWLAFEREDLDGLRPALEALPAEPQLLGLDFERQSSRIRDFPTYHMVAYGQALRGGTLNRSFADQGSSFVVFRNLPKDYPWTRELDWRPERLRASDIDHFDHVLVHGPPTFHASFAADPRLALASPPRRWRLYRVAATANAPSTRP